MTLSFILFKLKTQILSKQHSYINLKFNLHKLYENHNCVVFKSNFLTFLHNTVRPFTLLFNRSNVMNSRKKKSFLIHDEELFLFSNTEESMMSKVTTCK